MVGLAGLGQRRASGWSSSKPVPLYAIFFFGKNRNWADRAHRGPGGWSMVPGRALRTLARSLRCPRRAAHLSGAPVERAAMFCLGHIGGAAKGAAAWSQSSRPSRRSMVDGASRTREWLVSMLCVGASRSVRLVSARPRWLLGRIRGLAAWPAGARRGLFCRCVLTW
jgi:hypothetical protein